MSNHAGLFIFGSFSAGIHGSVRRIGANSARQGNFAGANFCLMKSNSSEQATPPIFIDEHGDISVFLTVCDSESWMEVIDVQNKEYVGYDSLGRLLQLSTEGDSVRIILAENQPTHARELAEKLRAFLAAAHDSVAKNSNYDLPQLVSHFNKFARKPHRSFWQILTGKRSVGG